MRRAAFWVGLMLAVATLGLLRILTQEQGLQFLSAILAAAAAVYIGAALSHPEKPGVVLETAMGVVFVGLALAGLWMSSAALAAGYFAHGGWDFLHHRRYLSADAGESFPVLCWAYDWVMGVAILWLF